MEWQEELGLNLYDMDMRDYDPAIGRWTGIDPVTHFSQSTYCAFDNNPVSIADPSGADGVVYGMAGQTAWSNPFPRGHQSFGYTLHGEGQGQQGSLGGNGSLYGGTTISDGGIFWGAENSRQNDHGFHKEDFMTTSDAGEILNVLLTYGSYAAQSESAGSNDIVSESSRVYKDLKAVGISDPNSTAPFAYSSITKVLKSKDINNLVKGANFVQGTNLIIDFMGTADMHAETALDTEKNSMITWMYKASFASWARLAMTVAHEGLHQIDYSSGLWNPKDKTKISTYRSEVRAWKQNEMLGDPTGAWMRIIYQNKINNILRN